MIRVFLWCSMLGIQGFTVVDWVAAMVWVQSLAQEPPHAMGAARERERERERIEILIQTRVQGMI